MGREFLSFPVRVRSTVLVLCGDPPSSLFLIAKPFRLRWIERKQISVKKSEWGRHLVVFWGFSPPFGGSGQRSLDVWPLGNDARARLTDASSTIPSTCFPATSVNTFVCLRGSGRGVMVGYCWERSGWHELGGWSPPFLLPTFSSSKNSCIHGSSR